MNKIILFLTIVTISGQLLHGQDHCSSTLNTPLGSTINEWDWRQDKYEIYRQGSVGSILVTSPFRGDYANYNIEHLYSVTGGVYDYEPIDGWELVYKHFGTDDTPLAGPAYMILYNRYESNLRVFCYVNTREDYNQAMINLSFDAINNPEGRLYSALLSYIKHPEVAIEAFRKGLEASAPNKMVSSNGGDNWGSYWLFMDIPVAYDPCTCNYFTELDVLPILRNYQTINLNISGGGTISEIVKNSAVSGVPHTSVLSNINGAVAKGAKTAKTLQGFYTTAEGIASFYDLIDLTGSAYTYNENEDIVADDHSSQDEKDKAQKAIDLVNKRKKNLFHFQHGQNKFPT
ncbi:MAG TPA: hypothetical protein ENK85_01855 [Saprospiraceae bacterium]|nr:hypothetical protein [Saprospiraceae bacterium]